MSDKLIDIKVNPGRTDLRVYALLWLVFFVMLGLVALGTEVFLRNAGIVTLGCWLNSLALNRDYPRRFQLLGAIIPAVLLGIWGLEHAARSGGWFGSVAEIRWLGITADRAGWGVAAGVAGIGAAGMLAMLGSDRAARALYRGWMFAALPIGWVVSHIVLGLVYFGVVTPIGLLRRALGHDPMQRRIDPGATTYWQRHEMATSKDRYFEQF